MPTSQIKTSSTPLIKDTACFDTGAEKIMLYGLFELGNNLKYKKARYVTVKSVTLGSTNYQVGDILEKVNISSWTEIECLNCNC